MSRYPDKASGIRIPLVVIANDLLTRVIAFGGYSDTDAVRPNMRGSTLVSIRGVVWGVTR